MTDDIVSRLRAWATGAQEQGVDDVFEGLNAAADEIERLRAERDEATLKICDAYGRHIARERGQVNP